MGRRGTILIGVFAALLIGGTAVAVRLLSDDSSRASDVPDAVLE